MELVVVVAVAVAVAVAVVVVVVVESAEIWHADSFHVNKCPRVSFYSSREKSLDNRRQTCCRETQLRGLVSHK